MIKKYGKIAAAAAFLTAAGFCYVLLCREPEAARLGGETWTLESSLEGDFGTGGTENGTHDTRAGGQEANSLAADGPLESALASGTAEGESADAVCLVHICGEVAEPGVYGLKEGSRIFQAVEAAGGFTPEAAADSLNLAAPVQDGMRVQVPSLEEAKALTEEELLKLSGQTEPEQAQGAKTVNLNTAGVDELTTLNGIGRSRAEDIVRYRTENGPFRTIEEIKNIPGIKDALFLKIKDSITV